MKSFDNRQIKTRFLDSCRSTDLCDGRVFFYCCLQFMDLPALLLGSSTTWSFIEEEKKINSQQSKSSIIMK